MDCGCKMSNIVLTEMKLWARICVSSNRQSVYNSAVKQARKEKYGKHSLGFMLLGNQDEKKDSAFFF